MRHNILKDLRKVVTEESITKLAFKHKFCQRSTSQIHGIDFLKMLIHQMSSGIKITYNSLNASLRCINAKICISNQAISKYLCRVSSANFLRSIYEKVFHFQKLPSYFPGYLRNSAMYLIRLDKFLLRTVHIVRSKKCFYHHIKVMEEPVVKLG